MIRLNAPQKLRVNNNVTPTKSNIVVGKPIGKTDRFSPLPESEAAKLYPADPLKRWEGLSTTTRLSALPEFLGGGQYVQDTTKPGTMLKTNRGSLSATREFNSYAKRGLISSQYQVDHIIPLALGGSDTNANKQVFSLADHAQKTAVGAVAQSLYFDGKIGLGQARIIAQNWQDKNIKGLEIKNGVLVNKNAVDIAAKKMKEWQEVKPVTFSDFWGAVKETVTGAQKKAGQYIAEKAPNNPLGEFAKGFVSEAALGYVPVEQENYGTESDQIVSKISQMAGRVVGFLVPATLVGKAIKYGSKALIAASKAKDASKMTKIAASGPAWVSSLNKTAPIGEAGGKMIFSQNKAYKMLTGSGVLGTVGFISKPEEEGIEDRAKNFLTNAAFGTIGGAFGGGIKGYSGVALSSYFASALMDENSTPADNMVTAAMMVGFHGLGRVGVNAEKMGNKFSAEHLKNNGVEIKPEGYKYTKEEALEMVNVANNNTYTSMKASGASMESINSAINTNVMAVQQLWKGGLSEFQKSKINKESLKSLFSYVNKQTKDDINKVPPGITGTIDKINQKNKKTNKEIEGVEENPDAKSVVDDFVVDTTKEADAAMFSAAKNNKNYIALTGTSSQVNDYVANNIKLAVKDGMKKGDKIVLHLDDRPEHITFQKGNGVKDPDKVIRAFWGNQAEKYRDVGYVPTLENAIGVINPRLGKYNLPQMDGKFSNVELADYMNKKGVKTITATVEYVTDAAKGSGEPFVGIRVTDADIRAIPETTKFFNKSKVSSILNEHDQLTAQMIKEKVSKSTIKYVNESATVKNTIKSGGDAVFIAQKEPRALDDMFNESVTPERKKQLLDELAKAQTVQDYYNFFGKLMVNGQLSEKGQGAYTYSFGGFTKEDLSRMERFKLIRTKDYNMGEIKQEISEPKERPTLQIPKPIQKKEIPVSEGQTSIDEAIEAVKKSPITKTTPTVNEEAVVPLSERQEFIDKINKKIKSQQIGKEERKIVRSALIAAKRKPENSEYVAEIDKMIDSLSKVSSGENKAVSGSVSTPRERFEAGRWNDLTKKLDDMAEKRNKDVIGEETMEDVVNKTRIEGEEPAGSSFTSLELDVLANKLSKKEPGRVGQIREDLSKWFDTNAKRFEDDAAMEEYNNITKKIKDNYNFDIANYYMKDGPKLSQNTDVPNILPKQIAESIKKTSDPKVKMFWTKVEKQLDSFSKGWREAKKINFNSLSEQFQTDEFTYGNMAGKMRSVDSRMLDYKALLSYGKIKELPKELQEKYAGIKKKYPNTKIQMMMKYTQGTNPEKSYNFFPDVFKYLKKRTPEEGYNIEDRVFSESDMRKMAQKQGEGIGEVGEGADVMEAMETESVGKTYNNLFKRIENKDQLDEQTYTTVLNWALSPLNRKDLLEKASEKDIDNIALETTNILKQLYNWKYKK